MVGVGSGRDGVGLRVSVVGMRVGLSRRDEGGSPQSGSGWGWV